MNCGQGVKVMFQKKLIGLAAALAVSLVLGSWTGAAAAQRKMRVVTSFYPLYIMALNVCKDVPGLELTNLTPPVTGCLHDYALTTTDMRKLEKADILVANGAGMESFLLKTAGRYPRLKIVELARGIPLIKDKAGPNPHVWVSVAQAITEVRNLAAFMARVDGGHASVYRKNSADYIARLEVLRQEMHARLGAYQGRAIVTFHEAFPYFAEEFGLKIAGVIEREPGSAPNAKELAETIGIIKKLRVKALFTEPQYPTAAADAIARETGLRLHQLDPAVTGPETPDAYLEIMRKNLAVLQEALK